MILKAERRTTRAEQQAGVIAPTLSPNSFAVAQVVEGIVVVGVESSPVK